MIPQYAQNHVKTLSPQLIGTSEHLSTRCSYEQQPLRILSFDGGVVRGISSLYLLQQLMYKLAEELGLTPKEAGTLRPCEYFDLICGTGTGGLIAILVGRLRYTVDEAIDRYLILAKSAFDSDSLISHSEFDHGAVERCIKEAATDATPLYANPARPDGNIKFEDRSLNMQNLTASEIGCRTFVVSAGVNAKMTLLRSYGTPSDDPFPGSIWDAARATVATSRFFSPITIAGINYGADTAEFNNPASIAATEACNLWPDCSIGCFVSIGTGKEDLQQLLRKEKPRLSDFAQASSLQAAKRKVQFEVAKCCARSLFMCTEVHKKLLISNPQYQFDQKYFRIDVPGFGDIGLKEWAVIPDVKNLILEYIRSPSTTSRMEVAARLIKEFSEDLPPGGREIGPGSIISRGILYISRVPESTDRKVCIEPVSKSRRPSFREGYSIPSIKEAEVGARSCTKPVASLINIAHLLGDLERSVHDKDQALYLRILSFKASFRQSLVNFLTLVMGSSIMPTFESIKDLLDPDIDYPITKRLSTDQRLELHSMTSRCHDHLSTLRNAVQEPVNQSYYSYDMKESVEHIFQDLNMKIARLKILGEELRGDAPSQITDSKEKFQVVKPPFDQVQKKLRHYRHVRLVSESLYRALESSCHDHEKHSALVRLQPHLPISIGTNPYIEFKLRFSEYRRQAQSPKALGNASWLSLHTSRNEFSLGTGFNNLSMRKKFCKLVKSHNQETAEDPELCLGYIESDKISKYVVLFDDAYLTFGRSEPRSLVNLMEDVFSGPMVDSMPYERVGLAKQLASAMLQFQQTPLLRPDWNSEDILFFGKPHDRFQAREMFQGPHLDVCITRTNDDASGTRDSIADSGVGFIMHRWTFALAVMLIEIAHQKPITSLVSTYYLMSEDEQRWLAADTLCNDLARKLGSRYQAVVRKCLDKCLSENGNSGVEKHEAFIYVYVINELEQLKVWMINNDDE